MSINYNKKRFASVSNTLSREVNCQIVQNKNQAEKFLENLN